MLKEQIVMMKEQMKKNQRIIQQINYKPLTIVGGFL
jgi:hypothetical protein